MALRMPNGIFARPGMKGPRNPDIAASLTDSVQFFLGHPLEHTDLVGPLCHYIQNRVSELHGR